MSVFVFSKSPFLKYRPSFYFSIFVKLMFYLLLPLFNFSLLHLHTQSHHVVPRQHFTALWRLTDKILESWIGSDETLNNSLWLLSPSARSPAATWPCRRPWWRRNGGGMPRGRCSTWLRLSSTTSSNRTPAVISETMRICKLVRRFYFDKPSNVVMSRHFPSIFPSERLESNTAFIFFLTPKIMCLKMNLCDVTKGSHTFLLRLQVTGSPL